MIKSTDANLRHLGAFCFRTRTSSTYARYTLSCQLDVLSYADHFSLQQYFSDIFATRYHHGQRTMMMVVSWNTVPTMVPSWTEKGRRNWNFVYSTLFIRRLPLYSRVNSPHVQTPPVWIHTTARVTQVFQMYHTKTQQEFGRGVTAD